MDTFSDRVEWALEHARPTFKDQRGHRRAGSSTWLARELHLQKAVSEPTFARYLKGERSPTLDVITRAARLLKVDTVWLATGEGFPLLSTRKPLMDRPIHFVDGAGTEGGGGDLWDEWTPPDQMDAHAVQKEFDAAFLERVGEWEHLSPTVQLLFGNLLARRLERAKKPDKSLDPAARGRFAGSLWAEVSARTLVLGGEVSGNIKGPQWSDLYLRSIAELLYDAR